MKSAGGLQLAKLNMGSVAEEVIRGNIGWRGYEVTDAEINCFDYTVKFRISRTSDLWFLDLCFSEAPAKLMKCDDDSCLFGNGKREASGHDRR